MTENLPIPRVMLTSRKGQEHELGLLRRSIASTCRSVGHMVRKGIPVQDVLEAAENLGRELVKTGRMSKENLKIVSRELVSLETYVEMTNKGFRQALDRLTKTETPL